MQKYNTYKIQYQKDQQSIKFFNKSYRKSLKDILVDKGEYECLFIILTKHLDEIENECFL